MDAALEKEVQDVDSAGLAKEPFVSITTFKCDGTPVSVPVWCAADHGSLLVFSEADSWKVRRIRRDPHVRLAPCSARGRPRGPAVDADASLVEDTKGSKRCWPESTGGRGLPTGRSWW
jgi:PPOX class probable F420-dependent enzyme